MSYGNCIDYCNFFIIQLNKDQSVTPKGHKIYIRPCRISLINIYLENIDGYLPMFANLLQR